MTTKKSLARHLLAAGVAAGLAAAMAPASAQFGNMNDINKMIKKATKETAKAAQQAAEQAAANANAAAAQSNAAKQAVSDIKIGKLPPQPALAAKFSVATVKPYTDAINGIAADLKGITTVAQATAYAPKFKSALPALEANRIKAYGAYGDAINSQVKNPENATAEQLMTNAGVVAEAAEKDMDRIEKLYPALAADFKKFKDIHEQE